MGSRNRILFGISIVIMALNTGCSRPDVPQDTEEQRTEISMMYPTELSHFEELVETEYPDIDLKVEITTTAAMNGDSERRLHNGHGTDLVITTLPTGGVQDYVTDLSAEDFATGYQGNVASPVMIGGQTRYLPLPGQYAGYILNKTIVEQLGMNIPTSNEELTEIFRAGRAQGKGSGADEAMFGLTIVSSSAIGSYIIGTQVPDFLGTAEGIKWMSEFKSGNAGFGDAWENSIDLLAEWTAQGYLNPSALSLQTQNATPIEERMLEGTLILSYGNIQAFNRLSSQSSGYEYVMIPYLSDEGNASWVTSEPDGYIGINSDLRKEGNEKKLDACIRILNLLSTSEGQEAWMEDTRAVYSYLSGFRLSQAQIPQGIADCVEKGYVYDLQMPSNVIQYYGKNMISVLDGKTEMKDALAAVDDYCRNGSDEVDYDQSIVGSVAEDLIYENYNTRTQETAIGNLIADAVREYSEADIAVVNGGGIRASLYAGDVLGGDLNAVCPYANKIVVVETKGSVIMEMLENGISQTLTESMIPGGRFLQVSGLRYSYRPMEENAPAELLSVTEADGSAFEPDKQYTVAITNYMAGSSGYLDNNGDGYTMLNLYSDTAPKAENVKLVRETGGTYCDALKLYFDRHREETIMAMPEGRIVIVGETNE